MGKPTQSQRLAVREKPLARSPVMYQQWRDLLFLHWKFDPNIIQDSLPKGLKVDTYQGDAYIGLVPFYMCNIRPRFCPAVPMISNFLEMNVRTYVYDQNGNPGVWFYSLDANQKLAVLIARKFFQLPYFNAKMVASVVNGYINYTSCRSGTAVKDVSNFQYQIAKDNVKIDQSSLEFFLIERYLLFAFDKKSKTLYSGQVHHKPYPLSTVNLQHFEDSSISLAGFDIKGREPDHLISSIGVDVDIFSIKKL